MYLLVYTFISSQTIQQITGATLLLRLHLVKLQPNVFHQIPDTFGRYSLILIKLVIIK